MPSSVPSTEENSKFWMGGFHIEGDNSGILRDVAHVCVSVTWSSAASNDKECARGVLFLSAGLAQTSDIAPFLLADTKGYE